MDVLLSRPGAAGVPLNTIAKGSGTALRRAIKAGRVDVVNLLIDSGASREGTLQRQPRSSRQQGDADE